MVLYILLSLLSMVFTVSLQALRLLNHTKSRPQSRLFVRGQAQAPAYFKKEGTSKVEAPSLTSMFLTASMKFCSLPAGCSPAGVSGISA